MIGLKFFITCGIDVIAQNKRQNVSIGLGGKGVGSIGGHQLLDSREQLTQSGPTPKKGKARPDEAWRGIVAPQVCSVASRTRRRVLDLSTLGLPLAIDSVPDGKLDVGLRCL